MFLPSLFLLFAGSACALHLPVQRRSPLNGPRSTTIAVSNPNGRSNTGFTTAGNGLYTATIYLQGQPFQVQVDSGSSDLWIDTEGIDVTGVVDTGVNSVTSYGDGSVAQGPIVLGNVTLGEFTVLGQALVTAPGSNATIPGADQGLLGIGPPLGSSIMGALNGTSSNGLPFLQNVFASLPDDSHFVTLLLSRSALGNAQLAPGGALTIGELINNYTEILDAPKLPVVSSTGWLTVVDGVTVNGLFYPGNSTGIPAANRASLTYQPAQNQSIALLDSGTGLARIPQFYLDAMYKDLPDAVFVEEGGYYQLPCDTKVNISMIISNMTYPLHPIDSVIIDSVNTTGAITCRGAFSAEQDPLWILGDTFMHNIYTLYYHGNAFLSDADADATKPYIQILSLTDADTAFSEYDELNARRIAENEYENFASLFNVTTPTALAVPPETTYSLVGITTAHVMTTTIGSAVSMSMAAVSTSTSSGASASVTTTVTTAY